MPSMIFELDCELEGGEKYTVVADQRDIARWEVQPFGWPIVKVEDQASMNFFRFLAWSAAVRQQLTRLTWEAFDAQLIEAMPVGDEEGSQADDAEDPGRSAPSASPS